MVRVTRLNNEEFYINPYLVETLEKRPDTVIKLTTGNKLVIKETPEQVVERIIEFNRRIYLSQRRVE